MNMKPTLYDSSSVSVKIALFGIFVKCPVHHLMPPHLRHFMRTALPCQCNRNSRSTCAIDTMLTTFQWARLHLICNPFFLQLHHLLVHKYPFLSVSPPTTPQPQPINPRSAPLSNHVLHYSTPFIPRNATLASVQLAPISEVMSYVPQLNWRKWCCLVKGVGDELRDFWKYYVRLLN